MDTPTFDTAMLSAPVRDAESQGRPLYLLFLATRPCFIKLASLVHALAAEQVPHLVIDTGQHFEAHLTGARRELDYEHRIAAYLSIRGDLVDRSSDTAAKLKLLDERLRGLGLRRPAIPIVSGDTSTAGTVPSLWYLLTGARSVHVEAGLRSEGPAWPWPASAHEALETQREAVWERFPDEPFPEGMCTRLASVASQLLFAPVERNRDHLLAEAYREEQIRITGSLSADAVEVALEHDTLAGLLELHPRLAAGPWLRVDVHRRENMKPARLTALLQGIAEFSAAGAPTVLVRTNALDRAVAELGLQALLGQAVRAGVLVTPPWPSYTSVVQFLRSPLCRMVLTDSGGLQEEAHLLGVQCLTARWSTDRPETVLSSKGNLLLPLISGTFVAEGLASRWKAIEAIEATGATGANPAAGERRLYGQAVARAMARYLADWEIWPTAC